MKATKIGEEACEHVVWIESGNCTKADWVDMTPPNWADSTGPIFISLGGYSFFAKL